MIWEVQIAHACLILLEGFYKKKLQVWHYKAHTSHRGISSLSLMFDACCIIFFCLHFVIMRELRIIPQGMGGNRRFMLSEFDAIYLWGVNVGG